MGFWDDVLEYAPAIGGGIIGSFAGPEGAMIGAGIGGGVGNMLRGPGGDDAMARYQKLMDSMPKYEGPQPGQGLTAADLAAFDRAKQEATGAARSHEQGVIAADLARSGGASQDGKLLSATLQTGQNAIGNLHNMDMGIAGTAADRDRMNRMMLNDFNQRNMMMRTGITGSMADLSERQDYASRQNFQGLTNMVGNAGLTMMNNNKADARLKKYFEDSRLYKDGPGNVVNYNPEANEGTPRGGGDPMAQASEPGDFTDYDPNRRVA